MSLEDFLHKAIASFEHGWPDFNYLEQELRITENSLRPKEMILRNMIGREIKKNSELGNYLYDQFKDLPALIQNATTLQNAYYQTQNAQGHHPPRYTFYEGFDERLTQNFIDPMRPDAIEGIQSSGHETNTQESEPQRMIRSSWHRPSQTTSRRKASPSPSISTFSKLHQTAK